MNTNPDQPRAAGEAAPVTDEVHGSMHNHPANAMSEAAGFSLVPWRERNDCTVRAFHVAAGVDYEVAYAALARAGRRKRCAFKVQPHIQKIAADLGIKITLVVRSGSLARFLANNPKGTFLVRKSRHMFAVVDGVPHDHCKPSPRALVKQAWRVERIGGAS